MSSLHLHGKVITAIDLKDSVCFFYNKDMRGTELVQSQGKATIEGEKINSKKLKQKLPLIFGALL